MNVLGVQPAATDEETALLGIAAMEDFYRSIHMPTNMRELGLNVTDEQLEELADKCSATAGDNLGKMKVLHRADMLAIYTAAR